MIRIYESHSTSYKNGITTTSHPLLTSTICYFLYVFLLAFLGPGERGSGKMKPWRIRQMWGWIWKSSHGWKLLSITTYHYRTLRNKQGEQLFILREHLTTLKEQKHNNLLLKWITIQIRAVPGQSPLSKDLMLPRPYITLHSLQYCKIWRSRRYTNSKHIICFILIWEKNV